MKNNKIDWLLLLEQVSHFAKSPQSKDQILETEAYSHAAIAQKNINMIDSFQGILRESQNKRVSLESFEHIESILYSLKKAQSLNVSDLNFLRLFFEDLKALKSIYQLENYPDLFALAQRILDVSPFLKYIKKIITEQGEIRSDASHLLFESFNKKKKLSQQIHKTLDKLVKDFSLEKILQDKYVTTREGRWVLPVISGKQHDFKGIVHDASNSKQTVYMEPEQVVALNNKVRELEETIKREIERILKEISLFMHEKVQEITKSFHAAVDVDSLCSLAEWANRFGAKKIELNKKGNLQLKEFFHPLLLEKGEPVIKNDFSFSKEERILLLSGPNAGGKTVFLKSVGLACQMARCGWPVCAHSTSQIPFYQDIQILLGDEQSVEDSLSTFAAHLKALDQSTQLKGAANLLLIDEICGATEAGEGAALARAFIEIFSENKINAIITSHLGPLKKGWEDPKYGVINGSMRFDQEKGSSTFEFIKGIPGDSLAIETAKKVGVRENIVERALHFLSPEQKKRYSGLVEIENLQESLKTQKELYLAKQKEVDELKAEYQKMIFDFKKEQDELLENSIKDFRKDLEEKGQNSKLQQILKNRRQLEKMKANSPKLIKVSKEERPPLTLETFGQHFPPGTPVYVPSLKRQGVIQGRPDNKGFVPIMSDSMRILIKWDEARPQNTKTTSTTGGGVKKAQKSAQKIFGDQLEHEVDLRGLSIEDALSELEDAIDKSLRLNVERLKVIHGHGTEKIKKNVRSFLSRHPLVKTWKSDSKDGASIALF